MTQVPADTKIYHIVHVDNLEAIVVAGRLLPDAVMSRRQGGTVIGMGAIKQRRLELPVGCHDGTYVATMSRSIFVLDRSCSM